MIIKKTLSFVASIITSTVICVSQRVIYETGRIVYNKVDDFMNKPSEESVALINYATQPRVNSIFQEFGTNDPFFKNSNDPLIRNNINAMQVVPQPQPVF